MNALAASCARRTYRTRRETQPMRSDRIDGQIDDTENGSRSGIADKVNVLTIPVIVEVPPLQGV